MPQAPRAPRMAPLMEKGNLSRIEGAITNGRFTPFLGAGASSLRPPNLSLDRPPWSAVASSLRALALELEAHGPDAYLYLRSFAGQRLRLTDKELNRLLPADRPDWTVLHRRETTPSGAPELLQFQCALVKLAAALDFLFGAAFARTFPAIDQLADCQVTVDPNAESYRLLLPCLVEGVRRAEALFPLQSAGEPPRLHARPIHRKLLVLASELIARADWSTPTIAAWWRDHATALPDLPDHPGPLAREEPAISLTMLQWISDLLWYTFRYRVPCYPTTAELAFELSLLARFAPARRAELAQAAEALFLSNERLADTFREMLEFCEKSSRNPSAFHLSIVAVLYYMYSRDLQRRPSRGYLRPAAEEDQERHRGYFPIAFTTNFDRALERAFDAFDIGYHVVFPVQSKQRNKEGNLSWMFKTVLPEPPADPEFRPTTPCPEKRPGLMGPVIVKLHGSPLDNEPPGHDHWLVLSETGYLEAMALKESGLPPWVEDELKGSDSPRSLWFLGYSVSDWNIRLRLYDHLRKSEGGIEVPDKSVIDRRKVHDWFQTALFGQLNVEVFEGDLNGLPTIVLDALSEVEADRVLRKVLDDLRRAQDGA